MMNVLIVSDSHGLTSELTMLKEKYMHEVDAMLHCGDSELHSSSEEVKGLDIVCGNCDYGSSYPNELVKDVESVRFFVTHGHLYNIKQTLQTVIYRSKEVGAQVACFGHSHIRGAELVDGVLLINPGSILLPRLKKEKTYALLSKVDNVVTVKFLDLNHNEVQSETFILE